MWFPKSDILKLRIRMDKNKRKNEQEKDVALSSSPVPLVDLSKLKRGAIVRHVSSAESYVVTDNNGDRVTAVRIVDITNPPEWLLIKQG